MLPGYLLSGKKNCQSGFVDGFSFIFVYDPHPLGGFGTAIFEMYMYVFFCVLGCVACWKPASVLSTCVGTDTHAYNTCVSA